jgi:hypothetical protein
VAANESPRTPKLYDHTVGEITLDEVKWITIQTDYHLKGASA